MSILSGAMASASTIGLRGSVRQNTNDAAIAAFFKKGGVIEESPSGTFSSVRRPHKGGEHVERKNGRTELVRTVAQK